MQLNLMIGTLKEFLRIADETQENMLALKLADCIDCAEALARSPGFKHPGSTTTN